MTTISISTAIVVALVSSLLWIGLPYWQDQRAPLAEDPPVWLSLDVAQFESDEDVTKPTTPTYKVHPGQLFSDSYEEARAKFRLAAQALQNAYPKAVDSDDNHQHGSISLHQWTVYTDKTNGQEYTTDVVVIPGNAAGLVVHSSGVHGVEGYAGSAVQVALLQLLREHQLLANTSSHTNTATLSFPTIVLIHAVNPYGMARFRRTDQDNVDLNRNGLPDHVWTSPYVLQHKNRAQYERFSQLFFNPRQAPTVWRATVGYAGQAVTALLRYGLPQLKEAMVRGQYHDPTGIIYGGQHQVQPSWALLRDWLQPFLTERNGGDHTKEAVTWIDLHTGLGPFGVDTLLMGSIPGTTHQQEIHAHMETYFPGAQHPGSSRQGRSVAQGYETIRGSCQDFVQGFFAVDQKPLIVTQEFGTLHTVLVGRSLIVENAAHHYLPSDKALAWAQQTTRPAFYPSSRVWRRRVLTRGIRLLVQAMHRSKELSLK